MYPLVEQLDPPEISVPAEAEYLMDFRDEILRRASALSLMCDDVPAELAEACENVQKALKGCVAVAERELSRFGYVF